MNYRWNTTTALACQQPAPERTKPCLLARTSIVNYLSQNANYTDENLASTAPRLLNSIPEMLAEFHRAMATRDMDQIWPLYSHLHQNDAIQYLTRRNYRTLFLCTIRARTTRKNLHRLLVIVDDMRERNMKIRFSEYDSLIRWVGGIAVPSQRSYHLTEAMTLFDEMLSSSPHNKTGHPRLVAVYNALIHVSAQLLDMPTAQRLYHDMMARNIRPNAHTYSSLLIAMGRMGDIAGMELMWDQLRATDLPSLVNGVTWNIVMACYATHGLVDQASQLFQQMYDAHLGSSDSPPADAESFRIYLSMLLRDHRRDEALNLLNRMAHHGLQPTTAIYNAFFASFMTPVTDNVAPKEDTIRDAPDELALLRHLYASMRHARLLPNSDTLYTLVSALLDLGDTTFALKTFVQLGNDISTPTMTDMRSYSVADLVKHRHTLIKWDPLKIEACEPLIDRLNNVISQTRALALEDEPEL